MIEQLKKLEDDFPNLVRTWLEKNPKHSRIIPRVIIFMFISTIGSGFVYTEFDFIVYISLLISMFFLLFFFSFEKIFSNYKK